MTMAIEFVPVSIKLRRGTAAEWTSADPVLADGEPGLETDTNKLKFGDGTTIWSLLPYFSYPTNAYDIHVPFVGKPAASQVFTLVEFQRAVTFAAGFPAGGKVLTANPASTYGITLTIYNSSGVSQASGTLSISTGGVFTLAWASSYTTSVGDYLVAQGGAADSTLDTLSFTLVGTV